MNPKNLRAIPAVYKHGVITLPGPIACFGAGSTPVLVCFEEPPTKPGPRPLIIIPQKEEDPA